MLSPGSPSMFSGPVRVSFIKKGEEIERAMSCIRRKEVRQNLKKIAKELIKEIKDYSIAIFTDSGQVAIADKTVNHTIEWKIADREVSSNSQKCMVKVREEYLKLKDVKITDAGLARKEKDVKDLWWVSISTCKTRVQSIMAYNGEEVRRSDYVPSIYEITSEGVKIKITKTSQTKEMEKNSLELNRIFGTPDKKPTIPAARIVVTHSSVKDERVKRQLQMLKNYVVTERVADDKKYNTFLEVAKRIAIIKTPDEKCLEMIHSVDTIKDKGNRAKYRIGAYIPNANVILEYTRFNANARNTAWFPLKYTESSELKSILKPIKNEDKDTISDIMQWNDFRRLQPRIICILQDRNGKKIVNSCIYDICNLREAMGETLTNKDKLTYLPAAQMLAMDMHQKVDSYPQTKAKEGESITSDTPSQRKEKDNPIGTSQYKTPRLPIAAMVASDEWEQNRRRYCAERSKMICDSDGFGGSDDELDNNKNKNNNNSKTNNNEDDSIEDVTDDNIDEDEAIVSEDGDMEEPVDKNKSKNNDDNNNNKNNNKDNHTIEEGRSTNGNKSSDEVNNGHEKRINEEQNIRVNKNNNKNNNSNNKQNRDSTINTQTQTMGTQEKEQVENTEVSRGIE